ncbi:tRNA pseudouridine synthase D [Auricularia subglabra TFB-10046 SS5]|nr:tRNA pseudouridine synthase D [Auricularia subglabra TFB-10046 SS5]
MEDILPPSIVLVNRDRKDAYRISERDVGITEYIAKDVPCIDGIIKQRFTDFLVYEVNQQGEVVHIKDMTKPDAPKPEPRPAVPAPAKKEPNLAADGAWHQQFDDALSSFLSPTLIAELKKIYEEGPEPPLVSDSGWGQRGNRASASEQSVPGEDEKEDEKPTAVVDTPAEEAPAADNKGRGRNNRRGRGGKAKSARAPAKPSFRDDHRKVISDSIDDKTQRSELHNTIRTLFRGKLESETLTSEDGAGANSNKIVMRWKHGQGRYDVRKKSNPGQYKPKMPPYVHFTMQKTNRDTQDAVSHLARMLKLHVRDFGVAGTKDKRGVTVQRVSVKSQGRTLETLWKAANNVPGRRSVEEAVTMRGERGVRVGDFAYADHGLELGMLKGNAFIITLRNVKAESEDVLNRAMESMKTKGFINYYGMQRFGTAGVPTHSIGLALLQSDWKQAVSLILRPRPGEHPDVEAGRRAWLDDWDLDKALQLLPRRVVAERCILENFKKQGRKGRNWMTALSTIPRNLRTMYVHAYQSYVWNAVVSERLRRYGADRAIPGDLVYANLPNNREDGDLDADMDVEVDAARDGPGPSKNFKPKAVIILTEESAHRYTIFDVIMPLPGRDVVYPAGDLGELYRQFLTMDGLDPDNLTRINNREYSLLGSYRKIVQLPQELSWSVLHYTDPDVSLAQSDEDAQLGLDIPAADPDGKFVALQIRLTLTTAAYATMALREVTKTETSSHYQSQLTKFSEDQAFRGGRSAAAQQEEGDADGDVADADASAE